MMIAGFLFSFSAVAQTAHSVTVNWGASTSPNVLYNVYRSNTSGVYGATALTSLSGTSYTDFAVQEGLTYFYVVRAVDAMNPNNLSAPSNEAVATIPVTTPPPPQSSHINLLWQQDVTNVPVIWYMGGTDSSTMLSAKAFYSSLPTWRIVGVGDLNGDGHPDIVWQQDGTNIPCVWYMGGADGSTMLSAKILGGAVAGWRIVGVADMNGDRHPDLIWQQDGTNVPGIWYMGGADGSVFLSAKGLGPDGPEPGWRIVGVADLNGDGHPDLIWQQDGTNVPGVWYMGGADGSVSLSSKTMGGAVAGWRIVGVADLNGDGHPDLVWQQDGTNVPGVWYMGGADGSVFQSAKGLGPTEPGWRVMGVLVW
jgi:hypothetical protein